jgi:hypothetical protein
MHIHTRMRRIGVTTIAITLGVAGASAGTFFRLEIGPPVAGSTNYKLKGAVLAVRALVCDDMNAVHVTGTAEGMVNGSRQSLPLRIIPAGTPGIFMVQQEWPMDGQWVLHLAGTCPSPKAEASTIVPMNKSAFIREKINVMAEPATKKQIDAALADLGRP